jgi:hypothetical protein
MRTYNFIFCILLTAASLTSAQDKGNHEKRHNHQEQQKSQYKSEINNEIKALSSAEIEQLLNGEGMGLAKAAELNRYPGPKHVLDLSSELHLTEEQQEQTKDIIEAMKTEAVRLGKSIIEKENELELMFRENEINERLLFDLAAEIGLLKGELRFVHLNAHIKEKNVLTMEQIELYNDLRGYKKSY